MSDYIYEVVDESSDEVYFALGFYKNFEEAKDALMKKAKAEYGISEYCSDFEVLCIRQHKVGWNDNYKEVFKVTREIQDCNGYDCWKIIEIINKKGEKDA